MNTAALPRTPSGRPRQSFARGGLLNIVGAGLNGALTFGLVFALTRRIGQDQVGAFMVGVAALTILSQTAQLGANTGLMRFIPMLRVRGQHGALGPLLRRVFPAVAVAGLVGGIFLFSLSSVLARALGDPADAELAVEYLRLFAPIVPFAALFLVAAQCSQAFGTMTPAVVVDKIGRAVMQIVGVALFASAGAASLVGAYGIAYPLGVLLLLIWIFRLLGHLDTSDAGGGAVVAPPLAEFWKFSAPRALSTTFQVTVLWLDTILLAFLRSVDEAAVYSVATRYLAIGHLVIGALLQAMSPRLSEFLALGAMDRVQGIYRRTTTWIIAVVWPSYIGIAVFAPWLLSLFGDEYVEGATALRIVAVAMMVAAASGPVDNVLLMAGRSWWSVGNWGAALTVNVILNFMLIPLFGIEGAAIAWAASILVRNVVPVAEVWYLLGVHPFSGIYFRLVVASISTIGLSSIVSALLLGQNAVAVAVGTVPAALVYGALVQKWRFAISSTKLDIPADLTTGS